MKKIEQVLKNILLNLLLLFTSGRSTITEEEFGEHSKILIIRLNRIGDALVTTPLLHIIKQKLNCHISVLADRNNHFIFRNNRNVDEVIILQKGINGFFKIKKYFNQNKIDVLVDSHDDVSTTVSFITAFSKVVNRFALKKENYKLFTKTIDKPDPSLVHVVDRIKIIGELFNINVNDFEDKGVEYFPSTKSFKLSNDWIDKLNPENKFLVGINISAGSEARFWGIENYAKLVKQLEDYNITTILFTAKEHREIARQIIQPEKIFPEDYGYDVIDAAVMKLNLLFSPDTALIHIASVRKIPVFGLYVNYNTNDMIWSPYKTPFECIITKNPTLKNVYFEEVQNKFMPYLEKQIDEQNYS